MRTSTQVIVFLLLISFFGLLGLGVPLLYRYLYSEKPEGKSAARTVDALWVDTRAPQAAQGTVVLASQGSYRIVVEGTYSVWSLHRWGEVCAGTPESQPRSPSSGAINGPVGTDAMYLFAIPRSTALCRSGRTAPLPRPAVKFEISLNGGRSWFHPQSEEPLNAQHTYTLRVTGQGYPLQARFRDGTHHDNYGRLRVSVHTGN